MTLKFSGTKAQFIVGYVLISVYASQIYFLTFSFSTLVQHVWTVLEESTSCKQSGTITHWTGKSRDTITSCRGWGKETRAVNSTGGVRFVDMLYVTASGRGSRFVFGWYLPHSSPQPSAHTFVFLGRSGHCRFVLQLVNISLIIILPFVDACHRPLNIIGVHWKTGSITV